MIILSGNDINGLLSPLEIIAAVERAAVVLEEGRAIVPARLHMEWKNVTALAMPAATSEFFGAKIVSVCPTNLEKGLPVTNGLMILNNGNTGLPIALINGAELTCRRTGAVGALGIKYMTPENSPSLGIVGCGVQGTWQAIFACNLRPIKGVFCFRRSNETFRKFAEVFRDNVSDVSITPCHAIDEVLAQADIVVTATTSTQPVLPDAPSLLDGKHFISVGSFKPTMQELPDAVYRLAGQLAIDSDFAKQEVGDVINPLDQGILQESDVYCIGELVTGKRSVDVNKTTAYKSTGMALYDLFVAHAIYEAAMEKGIGREIEI